MDQKLKKLVQPWILFIILGIFVLIWIILQFIYAQALDIEPDVLIEEYTKFIGGIISMLFGFYLVNMVWDQRMKAYQVDRFKKILGHFCLKINTLCQLIKQLLAINYSTEQTEENQQRDHRVQEVLQKLSALSQGIENYAPEVDLTEDAAIRDMAVAIWSDIQTNLDRLPVGQDFRIDLDEFEETINALIDSTERALAILNP